MAEEQKEQVEQANTEEKKQEKVEERIEKKEEKVEKIEEKKIEEKIAEKPVEKTEQAVPQRVKASNCTQCNKVLKRGNWYYRNGKFYCNKRCWKKSTEKVA